jgi:hypothetical protein
LDQSIGAPGDSVVTSNIKSIGRYLIGYP